MPRLTRNSQESAIPGSLTASNIGPGSQPNSAAVANPVLSNDHQPNSAAVLQPPSSQQLIASVVDALKAPLASMVEQAIASARLSTAQSSVASSSASQQAQPTSGHGNISGGVPSLPAAILPPPSTSTGQDHGSGRPISCPTFLNTFPGVGQSSIPPIVATSQPNVTSPSVDIIHNNSSIFAPYSAAQLQKPFVVGPGYSPVPHKVVSLIITGKFVHLEDLLSENINFEEPEPELLLDGRLLLTNTARKPKRRVTDIITWLEAFTIYTHVLCSYFPHRWADLTKYKLLIVRTFRQFGGQGWLNYDCEFRQHAAAERLTDWSTMNVQLYNFNTAGAPMRPRLYTSSQPSSSEPSGSVTANVICLSWNSGHCVAPSQSCRFKHVCSKCRGNHRASACEMDKARHYYSDRSKSQQPEDTKRRRR
jgi:hypothetical protein